jgi:hypothetical protein
MDQKQFEAMLSDAEIRLRRLKTLYDQWFSGLERLEPSIPRKELDDLLGRLKREQIRNTALRFRLQQVHSRYITLNTYWKRISRQIEEGTYQRDVLRARKLRDQIEKERLQDGSERPERGDASHDVDVDLDSDLEAALADAQRGVEETSGVSARPAAPTPAQAVQPAPVAAPAAPSGSQPGRVGPPPVPPKPPAGPPRAISPFALPSPGTPSPGAKPPPPPPPRPGAASPKPAQSAADGGGSLSSDDVQRIYARYVEARKNNAERVDNVKMETIEKSLRGMLPQLEKKHAGKKIDFEVVVKDGKVALKPVAK